MQFLKLLYMILVRWLIPHAVHSVLLQHNNNNTTQLKQELAEKSKEFLFKIILCISTFATASAAIW